MAMTVIQALVLTVDRAKICMGILLVTVLQALLAKGVKQISMSALSSHATTVLVTIRKGVITALARLVGRDSTAILI